MAGLGVAAYAVHEHAEWVASILGGGVISSGVIAFLRGKAGITQPDIGKAEAGKTRRE